MSIEAPDSGAEPALTTIRDQVERGRPEDVAALLARLRPADRAWLLLRLPHQRRQEVLERLPAAAVADALDHLTHAEACLVATGVADPRLANILDSAETEVAAGVLRHLPPETAGRVLEDMQQAEAVTPLLQYHPESAGSLMMPVLIALPASIRARDAINYLRRTRPNPEVIYHLFVVDAERRLIGMLTLPNLVLADPWRTIGELMEPGPVYATTHTDREDVARLLQRYDLVALPVVDEERHLLGVITADEVADIVSAEATEDMYRMVGLVEEQVFSPFWISVRNRLPWLCVNLATAFLAAAVVAVYQSSIATAVVLAVFLPVIASQGSNAGAQTLTILVRGLALGEIRIQDTWRALAKEVGLGLVNGMAIGLVTAVVAIAWVGNPTLGLVVGAAMVLSMVFAAFGGVLVPLTLHLLRVDPALASVIFVTTVTDVLGFLVYLGLASLFLPGLSR
ncbi:MAG: magnesium transporter [Chloroflexi bacterium]|nr:magnesium transporter [Chloroflexota bacterium]